MPLVGEERCDWVIRSIGKGENIVPQTVFCAQESRESLEDPIGSAGHTASYVLVEFLPPWHRHALDTPGIPPSLRELEAEMEESDPPGSVILIYSDRLPQIDKVRCLIFQQKPGLSNEYSCVELQVSDLDSVAPTVKKHLAVPIPANENPTRDILVCTHGSKDRCCAKYGNVFYRQALATAAKLSLDRVRIWQVSHFGGHRFAPTAIDLPQGRYYGRLDSPSFESILTQTGDLENLKQVYRGWGMLPWAVQFLERELMSRYGWEWFSYRVGGEVLECDEEETFNRVQLTLQKPNGAIAVYRADVVEDRTKAVYLLGSCQYDEQSLIPQYKLTNISQIRDI
jgi:hypothetical protein